MTIEKLKEMIKDCIKEACIDYLRSDNDTDVVDLMYKKTTYEEVEKFEENNVFELIYGWIHNCDIEVTMPKLKGE